MERKEFVMAITKDLIVNNIVKPACQGNLDQRTEKIGELFKKLSLKIDEADRDLDNPPQS